MVILGISIPYLLASLIVLFFGMGWHEYAHAIVADYWGDPTPRQMGRLTPNPLVHINWGGFVFFIILSIGAAGPGAQLLVTVLLLVMLLGGRYMNFMALGSVPVNPRMMRDPRWGNFWTSFAGPLANLLQAFVAAILLRITGTQSEAFNFIRYPDLIKAPGDFIQLLLVVAVFLNVLLFVYNLLPLFPFDGWHMMFSLLPANFLRRDQVPQGIRTNARPISEFLQYPARKWMDWREISNMLFILLIFTGFITGISILSLIVMPPVNQLTSMLLGA